MSYTLGIKRRFLPFFKRYTVTHHDVTGTEGAYRVLLTCADGSHLFALTNSFKLFPDWHEQAQKAANANAQLESAKAEAAAIAVHNYQAQLTAQMAAQRQVPTAQQAAGLAHIRAQQ